jgi:hypothetical protein
LSETNHLHRLMPLILKLGLDICDGCSKLMHNRVVHTVRRRACGDEATGAERRGRSQRDSVERGFVSQCMHAQQRGTHRGDPHLGDAIDVPAWPPSRRQRNAAAKRRAASLMALRCIPFTFPMCVLFPMCVQREVASRLRQVEKALGTSCPTQRSVFQNSRNFGTKPN